MTHHPPARAMKARTAPRTLISDPTPTNNEPIGKIVFLLILVYFVSWLVIGAQLLATWYQQRSRPGTGRHLTEPSPAAATK
jgi:hypothetical protein